MNEAKVRQAYQILLTEPRAGVACALAEELLRSAIAEGRRDQNMQEVEVVWQTPSKEPIGYIKTNELEVFLGCGLTCNTAIYKKPGKTKSPIYLHPLHKGQTPAGYLGKQDLSALKVAKQQSATLLHPVNKNGGLIPFFADTPKETNLQQGPVADLVGINGQDGHIQWIVSNIQPALWQTPKEDRHPWNRRLTVYAAPQTPTPWPSITHEELKALERFKETTDDGEGYDVPKPMMKRLADIGLVNHITANIYGLSDFGHIVLETVEAQNRV